MNDGKIDIPQIRGKEKKIKDRENKRQKIKKKGQPRLKSFLLLQQLNTFQTIPKVHNHRARVLARRNDPAVVGLGAQDPAGRPPGQVDADLAIARVEDLDAHVIAARHHAVVEGVEMQRPHQRRVPGQLADALARRRVELVDHLVVPASQDRARVRRELDACEAAVAGREFFHADRSGKGGEG